MGHATACMTSWEAPSSTASPEGVFVVDNFEESQVVDYIEENQPEFIRGTSRVGYEGRGRRQFEMDFPYVEGDKIVSSDGQQSVPIADITEMEGRGLDVANTVQLAGHIVMLPVYALGILLLAYGM